MAPHENADSSSNEEPFALGREEAGVKVGDQEMSRSMTEEPIVKTISSMGRQQSLSLIDLAEEGDDAEHDLVPVQEYYCSPTNLTPLSGLKSNQTPATSAASSISSSLSSTSVRLLKSSSFSFSSSATVNHSKQTPNNHWQHQPLHLQDSEPKQIQDQRLSRRRISLSPRSKAQTWEERLKPMLLNYLHDEQLEYFYKLHQNHNIASLQFLESLAYLASSPSFQEDCYWDRLYTLALYWSSTRQARSLKLASLQTLIQCLSPPVAGWQHCEPVIEGTLDFLLTPNMEWEFMDHTEMNLLLELRALCLCFYKKEQARIAKVVQTGDTAAVLISASAKLMEEGMIQSGQLIEGQLDKACAKLKSWVKPGQYPLIVDQNAIVAKAFSSAAKKASEEVKDSTLWLLENARDASSEGLKIVVEKLDETTNGSHRTIFQEQLSPESAETLKAVGKVGMATLGATALVGEAMVETSRALVRKTGSVAADIVEYKYGSDAGQVVLDASETADNLVRAASNVTLLERKVLAKNMAKSAGKDQIEEEIMRAKDSMHLLEIQMAGMLHQALGNGPNGKVPTKLLEGMKMFKKAQIIQSSGTRSPNASLASEDLDGSSQSQQAVMERL